MTAPIEKQRIKMMIDKLEAQVVAGTIDNEWVEEFICDIKAKFYLGRDLTPKQLAKLEELFERY